MKRNINIFGDSDNEDETDSRSSKPFIPKKKFKIPSIDQTVIQQDSNISDLDYTTFVAEDVLPQTPSRSEPEARGNKLNKSLFLEKHKSVGLTIMEKMGFKVGDTLGKSEGAITEPINVSRRLGSHGIGGELKSNEYKEEDAEHLKLKLTSANKRRIESSEIMKIMKLAFELSGEYDQYLDGKNIEEINTLWKPYAYVLQRRFDMKRIQSKESKSRTLTQYKSLHGVTEYYHSEETLLALVDYLRNNHHYCWYCGIKYSDQSDLEQHCPGKEYDVHLIEPSK